ncbi:DNA polymerase II large subunit [Archaeoglobus neptunius]|uniref:DNA polymerase II large subunit n=1 Tax=Archaeoglobus neptunius TaxID=2798580 RepID=UPI001926BF1F|nr:DNA polymerase II large subunit [Archaeoglobus neptunius]
MNLTLDAFFPLFESEPNLDFWRFKEIRKYHDLLLAELERIYKIAEAARQKGLDPEPHVEIPVAKNMAERVEKLMGVPGLAERIIELEEEGVSRETICFRIAEEIVDGKFGEMPKEEAIDKAVRTAVAIMTEGVVAAPIEGIARVRIDSENFLRVYYAGPIRSAGGTAQVISVLVADYVRRKAGIGRYQPTEEEILRYCEEIPLYKKVANLQYLPSDDEIRLIVSNCPICIDGEPTEDAEVAGYRNLPRVETNRVRGGMALVIAEGIALKAPKLKKMVDEIGIEGWEWLNKLIKTGGDEEKEEKVEIKPKDKYLTDIVAGRPVLSHPSRKGGFRLRYGRARNSGFATVGINPATMYLLDFIAVGTQLKIERPGKAGGVVPVSSIEGPTVRLKNGDVVKIRTLSEAKAFKNDVEKILDLGEILINYGDFLENNHPLIPSSYTYEWWIQEAEKAGLRGDYRKISEEEALKLCDEHGVPLHPDYTYLWHDIEVEEYKYLRNFVSDNGKIEGKHGKSSLILPYDAKAKDVLEKILIEHKVRETHIVIEQWRAFIRCLGLNERLERVGEVSGTDVLEIINSVSGIRVRAKAPSRIGARMGRPEKAKERKMSPPPHVLFPVGLAGGNTRDIKNAINYTKDYNSVKGEVEVEIALRKCKKCGNESFWLKCDCGGLTEQVYYCPFCKIKNHSRVCERCGRETRGYARRIVNIRELYEKAIDNLGEYDNFGTIKGVLGMSSKIKMPERLEKGILRVKHEVFVFKDGTARFDATDLPITHFRPREIGITVEKLKELGYERDCSGIELKSDDQIVELKPQDVILPKRGAEYLLRVANFIDELLVKFYGMEPFYNASSIEDLIGHLVIGLAPHTSAGVLGRIIGFSDVLAGYAHPYFHAAKRRNCDGDEDCFMLLLDGLLNFSRKFLPDKRGGQMDAPLVLTAIVDPKEVDKEVHNMDIVEKYPLEFYEATLRFVNPKDVEEYIEKVKDRLKDETRFCGLGFTHDTEDIAAGVKESAYKSLKTMQEKVYHQMELARKIAAVDEHDVAERVINVHFLPDIIGNLRAFSRQEFRCVKCNTKYRRIPLVGKCTKCGGRLTLTVHSNSIMKYLDLSKYLSTNFNVSEYTRQRLKLLEQEIKSLFENESEKQVTISDFV